MPVDAAPLLTIWVDADACPRLLRDLLIKTSDRHRLPLVFVANQPLGIAPSGLIRTLQVESGADRADAEIIARCQPGDLVVSQDIPLAAQAVEKGAVVISPRAELLDASTVRARLHLRDYMDMLRGSGVQTGGARPMTANDRKQFADLLEKTVQRLQRQARLRPGR